MAYAELRAAEAAQGAAPGVTGVVEATKAVAAEADVDASLPALPAESAPKGLPPPDIKAMRSPRPPGGQRMRRGPRG